MNLNKAKKIKVMFPGGLYQDCIAEITKEIIKFPVPLDINARILSGMMTKPTFDLGGVGHKRPRIECNITWFRHPLFPYITMPQILYASSDEKRLFQIIEKYGGKIIKVDKTSDQNLMPETDNTNTGTVHEVERVNEIIGDRK